MQQDPNFKQALKPSYQLLSYRPRSVYEIKTKLSEKGYGNELVERKGFKFDVIYQVLGELFKK